GGQVAGVIVEPTGSSWGQVPLPPGFLATLRELTERHGAVLIFDEVISGFRCAPGGAQAVYQIQPDLTTLAKILAGGLSGGAVGGRAEILQRLAFPDEADPHREKIPHYGTFNANPLSAAAGLATLELVATTDACQRANDYAATLRQNLNEVLAEEHVPWIVYGSFSGFHIFTNPQRLPLTPADIEAGRAGWSVLKTEPDRELVNRFRLGMLIHGVDMLGWPGGPTSAVQTTADLEHTTRAFRETLRGLRAEGLV
ncbi:MAG: aminotransferase class III-fold pyridoxal phosphate-dependent enzyme, partial [Planctomycetaceae bacterium]|nr:aminotransferase class III-fold pyridoxal phosphate-dependent enzyme [Planctomycetaceae bacterium]